LLLADKSSRSFKCPGVLGARLRPGSLDPDYGPADAILLDFRRRFFAVSDGSSRNPGTAGFLLARIAVEFENWPELEHYPALSPAGLAKAMTRLKRKVERAMAAVQYFESCTLTGLLLVETSQGPAGLVVHTGDSLLLHYRPDLGLRQISQTNFWLAGRSKRLYQLDQVDIPAGSTFLLVTDGLADLVFPAGAGREEPLSRCLKINEIQDGPDRLLERYDLRTSLTDDLSLVAVRPEGLQPCPARVILGRFDRAETGFQPMECSADRCRSVVQSS